MITAYDYKAQKWLTGDDAIVLRYAQFTEEIAILRSDRGEAYLRFGGSKLGVPEALDELQDAIRHLVANDVHSVLARSVK